ncbi:hypothetical protein BC829DRAFT_9181 [Chytridium lagenaria]|nr:hypothetical protein BC829DRAFT_9181 [Chytridium lagenaria]
MMTSKPLDVVKAADSSRVEIATKLNTMMLADASVNATYQNKLDENVSSIAGRGMKDGVVGKKGREDRSRGQDQQSRHRSWAVQGDSSRLGHRRPDTAKPEFRVSLPVIKASQTLADEMDAYLSKEKPRKDMKVDLGRRILVGTMLGKRRIVLQEMMGKTPQQKRLWRLGTIKRRKIRLLQQPLFNSHLRTISLVPNHETRSTSGYASLAGGEEEESYTAHPSPYESADSDGDSPGRISIANSIETMPGVKLPTLFPRATSHLHVLC